MGLSSIGIHYNIPQDPVGQASQGLTFCPSIDGHGFVVSSSHFAFAGQQLPDA